MTTISIYIDTKTSNYLTPKVTVSGPMDIICKGHPNTGFKFYKHSFDGGANTLNLYNRYVIRDHQYMQYLISTIPVYGIGGVVYVYFYEKDPRPLLVCYENKAYRPRNKDKYDSEWDEVEGIKKCECEEEGNEPLLKALTEVVGFLNQVNLYKHPPGTENGKCAGTTSGDVASITCNTPTEKANSSCTYPVHTYNKKQVNVKVTCSTVSGTSSNNSCYKKLTHTPAGLNGKASTNNGFRLGDVVYNNNGHEDPQGRIDYYSNVASGTDTTSDNNQSNTNKYKPLIGVTAYFYDLDSNYKDPLLVVLEFKNGSGNVYEYYKLTRREADTMTWKKDGQASEKVKREGNELVKHLDSIRYELKKVLRVEIHQKTPYQAMGRVGRDAGNRFTPLPVSNGGKKEVTVAECKNDTCAKLAKHNYKCYQHKISQLVPEVLNKIGGLVFTIPGQDERGSTSDKVIEIKLYEDGTTDGPATDCSKNQNGEQIKQLFYNTCMGDVYVFFYDGSSAGVSNGVDTVPLMLWYAGNYYAPCNRDSYFTRWEQVNGLSGQMPPCEGGDGGEKLVGELDKVNKELNRIELDKSSEARTGIGGGYGLPGGIADSLFKTARVTLKKQNGPSQPPTTGTHAYVKVVHRTVNGFEIGDIKYKGEDFATQGISINGAQGGSGTAEIKVKNGGSQNHTKLANSKGWNTVVAYYSSNDATYQLPQLIVILKTSSVESSTPVKASDTTYGYYILTSKGSNDYEYKWVDVTNGQNVTLNDATDFSLLNSVVIMLEQKCNGDGYNDEKIKPAIASAELKSPGQPSGTINRLTGKDITISVSDETEQSGKCLKTYGYKMWSHNFTSLVTPEPVSGLSLIAGFRFLIPNGDGSYQQLSLSEGSSSRGGDSYLYYQKSSEKVYVYFYQGVVASDDAGNGTSGDPRPLMLCYNDKAYKLNIKNEYFIKWTRATSIKQCECNGGRGDTNERPLMEALTNAVRYLNEVDLSKYPGNCNGSGVPTTPIKTCNDGKDGTCTYPVHKYQNKDVTVRVECQKIDLGEGADSGCYYKKMIHTHNGIAGGAGATGEGGAPGFRLGSVKYEGTTQPQVRYSTGNNKWNPLVRVTTYFYDGDTKYASPLLVILEFKTGSTNPKEYYKLKESGGSNLQWTKDPDAAKTIGESDTYNKKLIAYLNKLRYSVQYVVQIEIQTNSATSYQLKGGKGTDLSKYSPLKDKNIQVTECKGCDKLNSGGYKCFKHDISGKDSGMDYNDIGGLRFTVPGETGKGDIEIPLYNDGGQIPQIQYNRCMGDVYVFFYDNGSGGDVKPAGVDTVPLMLHFNSKWYTPSSRDEYFSKWVTVSGLGGVTIPCGKGDATNLVNKLNEINRALNQIDLDKSKQVGTGTGYGLPGEGGGGIKPSDSFPTMRVSLKNQEGPKQPPNTPAYTRIIHRTFNGFTIGDIKSNSGKYELTTDGFHINGTQGGGGGGPVKIEVKKNSSPPNGKHTHKQIVGNKGWNTVVAYYSSNDREYKLPQLIVILKTDSEVSGGTVTGSSDAGYGYYILTNKNGGSSGVAGNGVNYEYVWRSVNDTKITLDDATDFNLLNSIVILIDIKCKKNGEQGKYEDSQIGSAITSAIEKQPDISSPGLLNDINRIKGKTITVSDETDGTCLKDTGFKVFTHDISQLVEIDGSQLKDLTGVSLIAGIRFLIPTGAGGKYEQLKVFDSGTDGNTNGTELFIYHRANGDNKICVYFYQGVVASDGAADGKGDPRPLMFCYGNKAYGAKNMNDYFKEWYRDTTVQKCVCAAGDSDCDKLLAALVKVSNILNPVYINRVPRGNCTSSCYYVHWFGGRILMKVKKIKTAIEGFCYNGYMHSPEKPGFRLGTIYYGYNCIQLNGSSGTNGKCITSVLENGKQSNKHKTADKVLVYYYGGDKDYKNPLLVALCDKSSPNDCKVYYELVLEGDEASSTVKKYKKGENGAIELSDCPDGTLSQKLDSIICKIRTKVLQIILDKRPVVQEYTPDDKGFECNESSTDKELENVLSNIRKRNYDVIHYGIKPKPPTYYLPTKTCYKAQFYGNGQPSGSGTTETNIFVKEQQCKELELHGYRCYVHDIVNAKDIYEIGWLRFYLWDNTGKGQGSSASADCGTNTTSNGCPAAGDDAKCKELCLYKPTSGASSAAGTQGSSCTAAVTSSSNQSTCGTSSQPAQTTCGSAPSNTDLVKINTTYTTCKGNVYVYFYGEDPRPLMLCYDGNAYGPRCMDEYDRQWVCLQDVTGCGVEVRFISYFSYYI